METNISCSVKWQKLLSPTLPPGWLEMIVSSLYINVMRWITQKTIKKIYYGCIWVMTFYTTHEVNIISLTVSSMVMVKLEYQRKTKDLQYTKICPQWDSNLDNEGCCDLLKGTLVHSPTWFQECDSIFWQACTYVLSLSNNYIVQFTDPSKFESKYDSLNLLHNSS